MRSACRDGIVRTGAQPCGSHRSISARDRATSAWGPARVRCLRGSRVAFAAERPGLVRPPRRARRHGDAEHRTSVDRPGAGLSPSHPPRRARTPPSNRAAPRHRGRRDQPARPAHRRRRFLALDGQCRGPGPLLRHQGSRRRRRASLAGARRICDRRGLPPGQPAPPSARLQEPRGGFRPGGECALRGPLSHPPAPGHGQLAARRRALPFADLRARRGLPAEGAGGVARHGRARGRGASTGRDDRGMERRRRRPDTASALNHRRGRFPGRGPEPVATRRPRRRGGGDCSTRCPWGRKPRRPAAAAPRHACGNWRSRRGVVDRVRPRIRPAARHPAHRAPAPRRAL